METHEDGAPGKNQCEAGLMAPAFMWISWCLCRADKFAPEINTSGWRISAENGAKAVLMITARRM